MTARENMSVRVRAVILYEGKLLVVRHPHDTSYCALPGGHLEKGEEIKECLEREIIEELGVKPEIGRLLYVNNFLDPRENSQTVEFFFEIINSQDFQNIEKLERTHKHEIADMAWLGRESDALLLPKLFLEDFKNGNLVLDQVKFISNLRSK